MVQANEVVQKATDFARFGKFAEAEAYLAKVRKEDPTCFEAELEQIRIALFQDKVSDAFTKISEATKKHPEDPRLVGLQGAWFLETKDFQAAVAALSWVMERDPLNSVAALNLGIAYRSLGQVHESEGALLRSLSVNPMSELAHYEYSRVLTLKGQYEEAMQEVLKAIRINPYFLVAYMTLTQYLRAIGRIDIAINTFEIAIKVAPEVDFFYGQLANLHEERGEYAKALTYVQHLAATGSNYLDQVKIGNLKMMMRDFVGAEQAFKQAAAMGPEHWQPYHNLGELKLLQNEWPQAQKYYEKAVSLVGMKDSRPANGLGLTFLYQGQVDKAEPLFLKSTQINPESAPPLMNLAVVARYKKQNDKARAWAEKALALVQNDPAMSEKVQGILASLK